MIIKLLCERIDDFNLLSEAQQQQIANTRYSLTLQTQIEALDASRLKQQQQANKANSFTKFLSYFAGDNTKKALDASFEKDKKLALEQWHQQFKDDVSMVSLKEIIQNGKQKRLESHASRLATRFPLLNYSLKNGEPSLIEQIKKQPLAQEDRTFEDLLKRAEGYLAKGIFHCLQQVNEYELFFINVNEFNKKQAELWAKQFCAPSNKKTISFESYQFESYQLALQQAITKQLKLIKGQGWQVQTLSAGNNLFDSLSFLWNNKLVTNVDSFLAKMANAHAFIQATSFSTQNESSYLAILDIYNYQRHFENISEAQTVLANLFNPFAPLYLEYKDIALYEKNIYWKSIRSLAPIMILVAFILVVAVALSPLALPELAYITAFIPSLFMGLGLATKYVTVKNELYKAFRESYYGGPFEIPEFQVNERMLITFKTPTLAEKVRAFYINALAQCDQIEADYQRKSAGALTEKELAHRKETLKYRHGLALEWYDIHSNITLGYDKVPKIVVKRLHMLNDQDYSDLEKAVEEAQGGISQLVKQISNDIEATFLQANIELTAPGANKAAKPIAAVYSLNFFRPKKALDIQAQMETRVELRDEVNSITNQL